MIYNSINSEMKIAFISLKKGKKGKENRRCNRSICRQDFVVGDPINYYKLLHSNTNIETMNFVYSKSVCDIRHNKLSCLYYHINNSTFRDARTYVSTFEAL